MASLQRFRWVRKVGKYGELRGRNCSLFQRSCPTVYLIIPAASVSTPWWLPGYSLYKHKPGQESEVICVIVGCSSLFGVNLHAHTHARWRLKSADSSSFITICHNLAMLRFSGERVFTPSPFSPLWAKWKPNRAWRRVCVWASNYIHSVTSLHALEFPYVSVVTPAIHHNCSLGKTAVLASGIFTAHQPIKLHLILFQSSLRLRREVQNGLWPSLRGNSGAELLSSAAAVLCDFSRAAAFWGRWKCGS